MLDSMIQQISSSSHVSNFYINYEYMVASQTTTNISLSDIVFITLSRV